VPTAPVKNAWLFFNGVNHFETVSSLATSSNAFLSGKTASFINFSALLL
jgi:hypothetical protein